MKSRFWLGAIAPLGIFAAIVLSGDRTLADSTCPKDLEPLIARMLPELPGYINRVTARSQTTNDPLARSTVLVAGRPEFQAIELDRDPPENVRQVFITTLERTYTTDKIHQLQHFHWLFLTQAENGDWWLVTMFSSLDTARDNIVTPPRETSSSAIASGIRDWLRDCRASGDEEMR
ncbi:hypothetical protein CKA32_001476 [Geitlerinema sp. FC II]|nr:hypothetical protein [Geitlerinema sp. CS-897]PPT08043.1 hypothetical protein CKA32_001476 [Geitlerinema sp. FC II]